MSRTCAQAYKSRPTPGESMATPRSLPMLREGQRSRSSRCSSARSGPEGGLRAEVEDDAAAGSVSISTRHPSGLFARQQLAISTCRQCNRRLAL
jgi:hypothetical protein